MVAIRTRVFELALVAGYRSDARLARAMGVSPALVSRIRRELMPVSGSFIRGALRAFPGLTFDDLFIVSSNGTTAPPDATGATPDSNGILTEAP